MKYILQTDNETIEIPIIRSKRKTLGLLAGAAAAFANIAIHGCMGELKEN